jgi:hypothetical protein
MDDKLQKAIEALELCIKEFSTLEKFLPDSLQKAIKNAKKTLEEIK